MKELLPSFKETLFSTAYEIISEYAEIRIDALFGNEVLNGIPFRLFARRDIIYMSAT